MYDRTLAIYCFVDDLLKAMHHREDQRCAVSDAEVITTALCAMLWFGGNFERSRSFLHSCGMMPRMLSRSRLSRRLHRLADLVQLVFHQLGQVLKEMNAESRYALDSFPLAGVTTSAYLAVAWRTGRTIAGIWRANAATFMASECKLW